MARRSKAKRAEEAGAKPGKKRATIGTPDNVETIDIDQSRLSDDIPDEVKIAVANALIAYSAMEHVAERLIWEISGLSFDDGRLLTQYDSSKRFQILRELLERYGIIVLPNRRTTLEMWAAIKILIPVRNLLIHGVWAMLDKTIPLAISARLSSDIGQVSGEAFRLERLQAMERQCYKIKKVFDAVSERVHASPPVRAPKSR